MASQTTLAGPLVRPRAGELIVVPSTAREHVLTRGSETRYCRTHSLCLSLSLSRTDRIGACSTVTTPARMPSVDSMLEIAEVREALSTPPPPSSVLMADVGASFVYTQSKSSIPICTASRYQNPVVRSTFLSAHRPCTLTCQESSATIPSPMAVTIMANS